MRVLHILNDLQPSGAESMLRAAAAYWHEQSLTSDILSTGSTLGEYASTLEKSGYHIYHIPSSSSYHFFLSIYKFFKEQNYDVIHIHTEKANFWYALLAYFAKSRCIVRTVHSVFPFRKILRVERYLQRWIMRTIFDVEMVSIGASVKNTERKTFNNPSIIISNWFDDAKFKIPSLEQRDMARKSLGIAEDMVVFTSIGRCASLKNHSSIIEALVKLPKNTPVIYLHIGPEEEGYRERRLAEALGVSDRISFLGTVLDIDSILYASDVYIMPSLYEGFGIAALEAMGMGLPTILSDVPGLRDFRGVSESIYWVDPTPESIAKAIVHFLNLSKSDLREIGLQLSEEIHRNFAVKNGAGVYANLYRHLRHKHLLKV
jgi:glycosyltransferase involved in cell wall biosynthesis